MIEAAVIPVAGRGNRLKPLTDNIPKALIEIGGVPMSRRIVDQIIDCGVRKIVFIVGYRGDEVRSYYSRQRPSGVEYIFVTQTELDGTAGAVKLAKEYVSRNDFLIVFGDGFFAPDSIQSVVNHTSRNAFGVVSVDDPERYGVVVINNEGVVIDVEEKPANPKSNLVVGGIYKFSEDIWPHIDNLTLSSRGEYELPDAIKLMISSGIPISAIELPYMIDVGTVEELQRLNDRIAAGLV